jgi:hypothetical protein
LEEIYIKRDTKQDTKRLKSNRIRNGKQNQNWKVEVKFPLILKKIM